MSHTIGAVIVGKEYDADFKRCEEDVSKQVDRVATLVDSSLNLSEARNAAAGTLDADVYAFIDADAYPTDSWAKSLRQGFENGALAVGGPARPDYSHAIRNDTIPDGWEWLIGIGPFHEQIQRVRNTYGCNFAIRSDVFGSLGGFNESLGKGARIPHGEEMELARRMYDTYGERMEYRPDAAVYHRIYPEDMAVKTLLKRAYDQGLTKAAIGDDAEERGFVKDVLTDSPSLWELALLTSAGLGAMRGVFMRA